MEFKDFIENYFGYIYFVICCFQYSITILIIIIEITELQG